MLDVHATLRELPALEHETRVAAAMHSASCRAHSCAFNASLPPPLSPHVAAHGAAPPLAPPPPPDEGDSDGGGTPGALPPTPLPDEDGRAPSRDAFASGYRALAASLGGKPF